MKTRNGKIARLPRSVRDGLNQRLDDGEPAGPLLEWLNGLEVPQGILKAYFNGQSISPQNLSEWRQGGYKDWQRNQEACEVVRTIAERTEDLQDAASDSDISELLATVLSARLAFVAEHLLGESDPKETWRVLREILEELRHLRRWDQKNRRLQMEEAFWEHERDQQLKRDGQAMKEEAKQTILAPIWAAMTRSTIAKGLGGGDAAESLARFIAAIQCDLPKSDWGPLGQSSSSGSQPAPTQSS